MSREHKREDEGRDKGQRCARHTVRDTEGGAHIISISWRIYALALRVVARERRGLFVNAAPCITWEPARKAGLVREPAERVAFLPARVWMDEARHLHEAVASRRPDRHGTFVPRRIPACRESTRERTRGGGRDKGARATGIRDAAGGAQHRAHLYASTRTRRARERRLFVDAAHTCP